MIYGLLPVGGKGKRLGLPFSKEMLPQRSTLSYFPIIDLSVKKMKDAGASKIIFVHGSDIKKDIQDYYPDGIHIKQINIGFANVLKDFYEQISPNDFDKVLFGLPDSIFSENPFVKMVDESGIVCGLFKTAAETKVDRLSIDGRYFYIKSPKTDENQDWFWGVIKMDGINIRKMVDDGIFEKTSEIGYILNSYDKTFVKSSDYIDTGTWIDLNLYWSSAEKPSHGMHKLTVDAAYAFDYCSILEIKTQKNPTNQNIANLTICKKDLTSTLGDKLASLIFNSEEYKNLLDANLKTFEKIDSLKSVGEHYGDATEIDSLNYSRYLLKRKIQEKYFGAEVSEQKIGYKNNN